ncbi:hypothetical protein D9M70_563680 [compost metagenome]
MARISVPAMKPAWTALVSHPMSDAVMFHEMARSGAALFALNHSDVPSNCATAITADGRSQRFVSRLGEVAFMRFSIRIHPIA